MAIKVTETHITSDDWDFPGAIEITHTEDNTTIPLFTMGGYLEPEDATLDRDLSSALKVFDLLQTFYSYGLTNQPVEFESVSKTEEEVWG